MPYSYRLTSIFDKDPFWDKEENAQIDESKKKNDRDADPIQKNKETDSDGTCIDGFEVKMDSLEVFFHIVLVDRLQSFLFL